jgi:hypothetical protein
MNISAPLPACRNNFWMTVAVCQQPHEQIRMLGHSVVLIPASAVGRGLIEVRRRQHRVQACFKGSDRESRTVLRVVEQQTVVWSTTENLMKGVIPRDCT